ncbi:MAG: DMT family transporter [Spirosomataceae bacterium]
MKENLRLGILYMVAASLAFASMGAVTRLLGHRINSIELVLFRNLLGSVVVASTLWKRPLQQVGGKLWLLIFRGIVGTIALYVFFYGITQIGLPEAITYQQTYPIFLALLSAFFLAERLNRSEWTAIFIGVAGIAFIFIPQMQGNFLSLKNHLLGISNSLLTALAYLSIRGLSQLYDTRAIVLSFMVSGVIMPLISLLIGSYIPNTHVEFLIAPYVSPTPSEWIWVVLLGIFALIGQILMTKSFSYGKAGPIAVSGYSNILFSLVFGLWLGDALPTSWGFVGIALIIFSGYLISYKVKEA